MTDDSLCQEGVAIEGGFKLVQKVFEVFRRLCVWAQTFLEAAIHASVYSIYSSGIHVFCLPPFNLHSP